VLWLLRVHNETMQSGRVENSHVITSFSMRVGQLRKMSISLICFTSRNSSKGIKLKPSEVFCRLPLAGHCQLSVFPSHSRMQGDPRASGKAWGSDDLDDLADKLLTHKKGHAAPEINFLILCAKYLMQYAQQGLAPTCIP